MTDPEKRLAELIAKLKAEGETERAAERAKRQEKLARKALAMARALPDTLAALKEARFWAQIALANFPKRDDTPVMKQLDAAIAKAEAALALPDGWLDLEEEGS